MSRSQLGGAGPGPLAPPTFAPLALWTALSGIPEGAWSLPSTFAGTGVHEGYRRIQLITGGFVQSPYAELFEFVTREFEPIDKVWLSYIDPGGFIIPHIDAGPWRERWHVPIQAAGLFNEQRPEDAVPFQVQHWAKHWVTNDTDHPRIHLVIDRDVAAGPQQPTKFQTFPRR